MRNRALHILGHTYVVEESEALMKDQEWGHTDFSSERIRLFSDAPEAAKLDTLLHEIGHVIFELTGVRSLLKGGKDLPSREETMVQAFGNAMVCVLTENPWVLQMANRVRAGRARRAKGEVDAA